MSKRTGPTNVYMRRTIDMLVAKSHESGTPIWKDVAEKLGGSRRRKVEVNLSEISRHAQDGGAIVIPGTVLGDGELKKSVSIAAWRFSGSAMEKIKKTKCKPITIEELVKINPKGTGVRILV